MEERRLTRQGRNRKAQLLARAAELFAERGYAETRVIDIVRAAGVAKGLFYWYFENKEALFRELIDDTGTRLRESQAAALRGIEGPLPRLFAGTRASVQFMAEHAHLYALMQMEGQTGTRFTDDLRNTTATHAAETAALIEAGQRQGVIRTGDAPSTLAHEVLGTVMHMVFFHRTKRVQLAVEALGLSVARFVIRGLAVSEAAAEEAERRAMRRPAVLTPTSSS